MQFRYLLLAGIMVLGLSGCSTSKDEYVEKPLHTLYDEASNSLKEEHYTDAAKSFEEVERQYPYSQWAAQAKLMAAYAYYQGLKYEDAVNVLDRFIQLHPGHRHAAYAYYLRALCFYERIRDAARDQKITQDATNALQLVVRRFPESAYAKDAEKKLALTEDEIAAASMEVGRFYLKKNMALAAVGRFREVVEKYQTTSSTPEALYRLVEAYLKLGLRDEAKKSAAVLGKNYPRSQWYEDAYELLK
ncbi:MAG: outer membrane protein assembly factor BamD [Alphaproteobacteria bacterium]